MNHRRRPINRILAAALALLIWPPAFTAIRAWAADKIHPLDAHLADSYTEDLDALLERKYIRVLTTYNRTNFFLARGKPHGFEYALLKEYQNTLNKGISRKEIRIVFEFIPVSRDRLIPDLVAGYGDIAAAGLTVTPERQKQVDFSDPYWTGIDEVLVTHKAIAPIRDAAGLAGAEVFVRPSSSYHESLLALNRGLLAQGNRPVRIVRADENLETEDILELVNSGAIARTVCDSHIAGAWAQVLSDIRVYDEIPLRQDANIAWAVRKTSPALKASLDRFVKSHRKGTRLGNIYFTRYYKNTTWIKNPLGGNAGKRLAAYAPLFKEFAARYGFDWRLIGAMAYQESGFDQRKVSPEGAVGVMQIRPQTAADPKVGIPDISSAENNIHASVKYLNFLRDHYFNDAAIRPRDQVRFSLAAYNAGPVKIRRARKMTRDMQLDPNRWFRNVEIAMLKVVGQETVRYVSNINKYYVIYRNAIERVERREAAIERVKP
jgi:membrane-bound lytic murein transglycosylase MltF